MTVQHAFSRFSCDIVNNSYSRHCVLVHALPWVMSRRKHLLQQTLQEHIDPPVEGQQIVLAIGSRGGNQIEVGIYQVSCSGLTDNMSVHVLSKVNCSDLTLMRVMLFVSGRISRWQTNVVFVAGTVS